MTVEIESIDRVQLNKKVYCVDAVQPRITPAYAFIKRAADILLSLCVFALGWLPMLIIAVWIKLDSRGPVIFRQERLG